MTRAERMKRLRTAAAQLAKLVLVPAELRVALPSILDELDELDARIAQLERLACQLKS